MGVSAYGTLFLGFEITRSDFIEVVAAEVSTCPEGHPQNGADPFCSKDGGKFEHRRIERPTKAQQIHEDPFDFEDWDVSNRQRVFVHLANSLVWKAITKHDPPHPPPTAKDYTSRGLPWFEHYKDDAKVLAGTDKTAALQSVLQVGFQKGLGILPENEAVEMKEGQTKQLADKPKNPNEVRQGNW